MSAPGMKSGVRRRSGAAALVESLEKAGVDTLFGYPGATVVEIFDRLPTARFRFVLARHEQGAVHMADGYARATGRPGVCIVTSGPGVTNAVTGLATANMDSVPLVVVSGQVALSQIGTDAFQEADTTGITRAVSKHNFLVHGAGEIPETVAQAFYIATHGKPGPVVIDIPRDCQESLTEAVYPERVSLRAYHPESSATTRQLSEFARLVNASSRPVILAGGGVIASGAAADVAALSRKADIPVATTLMGLGSVDVRSPRAIGMAGVYGGASANRALAEADLVIALGTRFNDRVTGSDARRFAHRAKIIHVDCDPSSIGKNVRVHLGIVADVKDVLTTVDARIRPAVRESWISSLGAANRSRRVAKASSAVTPAEALATLSRVCGRETILVADVGQNQMWCAQYWPHVAPRRFLTSGGMGTMGFAIPAAIGAAIARDDLRVVAVCGDGGAQMTFAELAVAAERNLDVTFVVFNNGALGLVRQLQKESYGGNYSGTILTRDGRGANERLPESGAKTGYVPDFVALAKAYGIRSWRVAERSRLEPTLRRAVAARGPALVELLISRDEDAMPNGGLS